MEQATEQMWKSLKGIPSRGTLVLSWRESPDSLVFTFKEGNYFLFLKVNSVYGAPGRAVGDEEWKAGGHIPTLCPVFANTYSDPSGIFFFIYLFEGLAM